MFVKINGVDREIKYTYNSCKHMKNFDTSVLADIMNKPFLIIETAEILLFGGLNHNPKVFITEIDVSTFLEEYIEENSLADLVKELLELLEDSGFFKSLQKNTQDMSAK